MRILQLLLLTCFVACISASFIGCDVKSKSKSETVTVKETFLHPLYFQDDIGQIMNFPFWFNKELLLEKRIESVSHIIYGSALDNDTENDLVEKLPKKSIVYYFNESGELQRVVQTTFSEGIIISSHQFTLRKSKWPNFYYVISDEDHLGLESANHIYIPYAKKKNVTQYDDSYYDERLHYIGDKKYFGALSVDSIAQPSPKDWVILGTPDRPTKKYKVKNKVKEKQVTIYDYWNSNFPKLIVNEEFPFTNKRNFTYRNGLFNGYSDSIFIDQDLITVINTKIKYVNSLPAIVEHIKNHEGTTQPFKKIEEFKYTYYNTTN